MVIPDDGVVTAMGIRCPETVVRVRVVKNVDDDAGEEEAATEFPAAAVEATVTICANILCCCS